MNLILHGIEAPNLIHTNTLSENLADIQEKDRYNVILANPPFGGQERQEVQQNFPIRSSETAYLFLQHFIKSLKSASRRYQANLARLTSFAGECFSGAKILRSLGAEEEVTEKSGVINREVLEAGEKRVSISASFSSGASLLLNLLLLLVLWYGVHLVLVNSLPLNELAAFVLYGAIVAVSFSFLIGAYTELMQGMGGLERVFELLESSKVEPELVFGDRRESGSISGALKVEFSHVSFSYPTREELPVLQDLSLTLAPGAVTALVGPSGAGKSSIVQLLLHLYEPSSGRSEEHTSEL